MKEVTLTKHDLYQIKERTMTIFNTKSVLEREKDFLTECFTNSFIEFLNKKCYNIIDGKIYTKYEDLKHCNKYNIIVY